MKIKNDLISSEEGNKEQEKNKIPFNWPFMVGSELYYIAQAHFQGRLAGDGPFTERCHHWLETHTHSKKALLTHSCTAALEMSALLMNLGPGDEVIMPSFTFVSTANAFVLRGATPVFVDIREDTLNIDEKLIENAITEKTKAIVPVHYAGVGCEMDRIMQIANKHGLIVIEDAAQGLMASYKSAALGSIGHFGTFSFHETKNIISGEGGAILVNDPDYIERAEIVREKGTNRKQFFRGEVDKYTWQEVGSSYLPGELIAAFLWAQFENAASITKERMKLWSQYHALFENMEQKGLLKRPSIPEHCDHNAHIYYVLLDSVKLRNEVIQKLRRDEIYAIFHYVPLHDSPAGRRFGKISGSLKNTNKLSETIIRLPLWVGMSIQQQERVLVALKKVLS